MAWCALVPTLPSAQPLILEVVNYNSHIKVHSLGTIMASPRELLGDAFDSMGRGRPHRHVARDPNAIQGAPDGAGVVSPLLMMRCFQNIRRLRS